MLLCANALKEGQEYATPRAGGGGDLVFLRLTVFIAEIMLVDILQGVILSLPPRVRLSECEYLSLNI